jgi:hypothetical protein
MKRPHFKGDGGTSSIAFSEGWNDIRSTDSVITFA